MEYEVDNQLFFINSNSNNLDYKTSFSLSFLLRNIKLTNDTDIFPFE